MSRLARIRLVAAREVGERLRGRAIYFMTVITAALVVVGIVIPSVVSGAGERQVVALVGARATALRPELAASARLARLELDMRAMSLTDARAAVAAGHADAALVYDGVTATVIVATTLPASARTVITRALDVAHAAAVLRAAALPAGTVARAVAPVPLGVRALSAPPPDQSPRAVAAIAAAILLWVSIGMYGGVIASAVAQEKTSRTAEVLLASLTPNELLAGKVAGVGVVALGQMGVTVAAGLVANSVVHRAEIPSTIYVLLPSVLLWFLLGYAFYGLLFAAAGALVARQEEVQLVTAPFGIAIIFGYLLTYAAIANPEAAWVVAFSYVPPVAPVLMPARIALGHVAAFEVPVDTVVMVASIVVAGRLGARVYADALTRSGARLTWGGALRRVRRAA